MDDLFVISLHSTVLSTIIYKKNDTFILHQYVFFTALQLHTDHTVYPAFPFRSSTSDSPDFLEVCCWLWKSETTEAGTTCTVGRCRHRGLRARIRRDQSPMILRHGPQVSHFCHECLQMPCPLEVRQADVILPRFLRS